MPERARKSTGVEVAEGVESAMLLDLAIPKKREGEGESQGCRETLLELTSSRFRYTYS